MSIRRLVVAIAVVTGLMAPLTALPTGVPTGTPANVAVAAADRPEAQQLTTLLQEQISITADLMKATKAGDKPGQLQAEGRWQRNADQIAGLLNKVNPH